MDIKSFLLRFRDREDGAVALEFTFIFPVFFAFFLMTIESGLISLQHFMLERAVNLTVRDIRIGALVDPTRSELLQNICARAAGIPDCETELEIELINNDLRNWEAVSAEVECVDRGAAAATDSIIPTGDSNELMYMRACVRIDPLLPTTGLGKAIAENNSDPAAAGSYALVSTSAYVVEPAG